MMPKPVLIIIQCRFGSSRLPGKALWPLAGWPMLVFLIRRLVSALEPDQYRIVLATTTHPRDNIVAAWGQTENIAVFRGEEDDVLARYAACITQYPAAAVIRVTADNPLTCPVIISRHVEEMRRQHADYVQFKGLPVGAGVDIFSRDALRRLHLEAREVDEREHINLHILRNKGHYACCFPEVEGRLARSDLSLTVDTEADWQRVARLFTGMDQQPWKLSLHETIERMDRSNI